MATKAQMLKIIQNNITNVRTLPMFILNSSDFLVDNNKSMSEVRKTLGYAPLIVRSSSVSEDTSEQSLAGHFCSVLNVQTDNDLQNAIKKVIDSYPVGKNEEVLIQPMLESIAYAGVVFTADIDTLAPYYVINYESSGFSDGVTSGGTNDLHTTILFKGKDTAHGWMSTLVSNCAELEAYFKNEYLDIEFGVNSSGDVYIFQVRPIANIKKADQPPLKLDSVLNKLYKKIEKLQRPHPNLLGSNTVFGVMPDWNPAEIIGVRPKKLALSLYKELITDEMWAHQRNNYGYRNLVGHPLLVAFAGIPYIDVRITFNSFIPAKLHPKIAKKLADYYIEKLIKTPNYHDKVEFKIVYSCYYLGIFNELSKLKEYGFNDDEIKRIEFELLSITNDVLREDGLYKKDLERVELLEQKYDSIVKSNLSIIDKIYWLLEDCKQYGTLPFAGIARAAFIAVQLLNSFVDLDIITKSESSDFMGSISTINKIMNEDYRRLCNQQFTIEAFLSIYGHIRPGTYDISSKRYDEDFNYYFSGHGEPVESKHFDFTEAQCNLIDEYLIDSGINANSKQLLTFIKRAIEGREYSKFRFTKSLSMILVLMEQLGDMYDISREDIAFLDIAVVKGLYSSVECVDLRELFNENIEYNKKMYEYTKQLKLPSVILKPEDVYNYSLLKEEPNFITQKCVDGEIVCDFSKDDLTGKIAFILSADPGYDYIFSKNIAGLVCAYGGANSHMAIRCAELSIPAVIGIGEKEYKKWLKKKYINIDCLGKKISTVDN